MKQDLGMTALRGVTGPLAVSLIGQPLWPRGAGSAVDVADGPPLREDWVIRIGDTLPDLPVMLVEPTLLGESHSMALSAVLARAAGGGPCTFLIVYSTTCGACRRAAAAWASAPAPVREVFYPVVLWLSLPDSSDRIRAFHEEFGLPDAAYVLASAEQAGAMGVIGTPTVYAVDRSLRVVRMPGAAPEELVRGVGAESLEASCR